MTKKSSRKLGQHKLMPGPCSGKNLLTTFVTDYIQRRRRHNFSGEGMVIHYIIYNEAFE
jgi:hypothetical protein